MADVAVVAGALASWRVLADLDNTVAAFAASSFVAGGRSVGVLADLGSTVAAFASSYVVGAVGVLADLGSTVAAFASSLYVVALGAVGVLADLGSTVAAFASSLLTRKSTKLTTVEILAVGALFVEIISW